MKFPTWVTYTLIRVLLFAAPLAVLLAVGIWPWLAALIAAIFGLSASIIFLRSPRETISREIYETRNREEPAPIVDNDVEDAAISATEHRD